MAWTNKLPKRQVLKWLGGLLGLSGLGFFAHWFGRNSHKEKKGVQMGTNSLLIRNRFPLDFQWPTFEPFLFCVHHLDHYPKGNGQYGPTNFSWMGRNRGSDFEAVSGYRMYHGEKVPGFPVHPHRGFETVTIVRKGYVDHADSMGAAGRYGEGDVQWMTAGKGVQHCEMFPLLRTDSDNTVELFQIWLNLPAKNKMVEPHFAMFWNEKIPVLNLDSGRVQLSLVYGEYGMERSLSAPPDSWASHNESETQIYLLKIQTGGRWVMPSSRQSTNRAFYIFAGDKVLLNGQLLPAKEGYLLDSQQQVEVVAEGAPVEILVLQSRPIGEPVVQHGPFVMNTRAEIVQAFNDYQRDQFGGWSWERPDMVHGPQIERFAKFPDGRIEKPKV